MLVERSERCSATIEVLCADSRTVIAVECPAIGVVDVVDVAELVLTRCRNTALKAASSGEPSGGVVEERGPCFCFHEFNIDRIGWLWGL